jgi:hypothetical protein
MEMNRNFQHLLSALMVFFHSDGHAFTVLQLLNRTIWLEREGCEVEQVAVSRAGA